MASRVQRRRRSSLARLHSSTVSSRTATRHLLRGPSSTVSSHHLPSLRRGSTSRRVRVLSRPSLLRRAGTLAVMGRVPPGSRMLRVPLLKTPSRRGTLPRRSPSSSMASRGSTRGTRSRRLLTSSIRLSRRSQLRPHPPLQPSQLPLRTIRTRPFR